MTTRCKSIFSRKTRGRAKANTKTRNETARTTQATRAQRSTRANCGRIEHWVNHCWKPSGRVYDNPTNNKHRKARSTRMTKTNKWTLWKRNSALKQSRSCRILQPDVEQIGWIMGEKINSVFSTKRKTGAKCLLLDSCAQLHVRSIKYPGQKALVYPGIHTVSGVRLKNDGGRLTTSKLAQRNNSSAFFHTCESQKIHPVSW